MVGGSGGPRYEKARARRTRRQNMLRIQELTRKIQSAVARKQKPDLREYRPPQRGEEVIGTVSDPNLLALLKIVDDTQAEFILRWPTPPTNTRQMKDALVDKIELDTVRDLTLAEIRLAFAMGPDDRVVLRQGYHGPLLVKPRADGMRDDDGLTEAAAGMALEARVVAEEEKALEAMDGFLRKTLASFLPNCGNKECPIHGSR